MALNELNEQGLQHVSAVARNMFDPLAGKPLNFQQMVEKIKLYDLPVTKTMAGGVEMVDSPIAAFEHAGNWYVAPKVDGAVPKDPKNWSLIVNDFEYHPNTRFYHEPNVNVRMPDAHVEAILDIGKGLTAKKEAGGLTHNPVAALHPDDMANIILSKEREGAGLRLGSEEPLHQFIAEHTVKPFRPTQQEVMAANEAVFAGNYDQHFKQLAEERLALHHASGKAFMATPIGGSLGGAFSDPRERVFYVAHPENPDQVRRLKVGFDEMLMPDGTRLHKPSIKETTVRVTDALKEIGDKAHIAHAPEGISSYLQNGDPAGLDRYASTHMASDYAGRQNAYDFFSKVDRGLHQTSTHHMMGEELPGKHLTTQTWHRIVRPEDYVPQMTGSGAATGSTALETAGKRVFDSKRADYFMIRQHPDYAAAIENHTIMDYKGPGEQLIFLKGDPNGLKPAVIETVDLKGGRGVDTAIELRKRGIGSDTKLLKIGQDEYAELSTSGKAGGI